MKQVIDVPVNSVICAKVNTMKHGQLSHSVITQPLPAYVSQLALDNTELTDLVCKYKEFVSHLCHALNMSLESELQDIEKRVSKLQEGSDGGFGKFQVELAKVLGLQSFGWSPDYLLEITKSRVCAKERANKLLGLISDFTQNLHEDNFIELAEAK